MKETTTVRNVLERLAIALALAFLPRAASSAELYVAPDGKGGALPTLQAARDAVRQMKAAEGLKEPVRIMLRAGVYYLPDSFTLEPEDSGTEACPVTYAACPNEKVVVSGGVVVGGWQRHDDRLWVTELPEARDEKWPFRQLFVNGERRTLARSPNEGFHRVQGNAPSMKDSSGKEIDAAKIAFRYKPGDVKPWPDLRDGNIMVFHNWKSAQLRMDRLDEAADTLVLTRPGQWPFVKRERYLIENIFELLDAPGEWWLDVRKGRLFYYPLPGEDMAKAEVIAPRVAQIVVLAGRPEEGKYVEHVRFEGIAFMHSNVILEPEGHWPRQAVVTIPTATIRAQGARSCAVEGCELAHLGNYAIWFERGCTNNRIVRNHIHELAAGGVRIGEQGIPKSENEATGFNLISNNFIHDAGKIFHGAVGIWVGQSGDNVISHNEICDIDYSGISVGWTWGFGKTVSHRNIIEYNYLHHIGRGMLCDLGAIYTLGVSPGTKVRNNLIHHVWDWEEGYGASGIYLDEGSSQIEVTNNVAYCTTVGGFVINFGRDNVVHNNILAFARDVQHWRGQGKNGDCFTFERNIVYFNEGKVVRAPGPLNFKFDYNLYWDASGEPLVFLDNKSFEQWQALGMDAHSMVADPKFVNAAAFDFRLHPDSPAFKLGFKPIDVSRAGLEGPPEWRELPRRIQRPPTVIPKLYEPEPQLLDDGFETTPVGSRPQTMNVYEVGDKGTVRVVSETAASGQRSLKFVDSPGVKPAYEPHISFYPYLRSGMARITFALRPEKGAIIGIECRDRSHPYRVGPSLQVGPQGELKARDQRLMDLPLGEWTRFQLDFALGKKASGEYDLVVTPAGQAPARFEKLPCDPKFTALERFGFASLGTDHAVFYLDDMKLERR